MRCILTKWYNSFADWVLVSGFLFFNPLNIWFKRSGCAEGATEAIVGTGACSSYRSCTGPSSSSGKCVIFVRNRCQPITNQIHVFSSAWWSSSMIPPLGLKFNLTGGGPGFNSRSGPFCTYVICLAQPQRMNWNPISLVSAASSSWS
jgi:hypothetical protein